MGLKFIWLLLLGYVAPIDASKILVIAPSLSNSHLLMMGKLADALVKDGQDVTFFIQEYNKLATSNGTKLANIIRINNIEAQTFDEILQGYDMFQSNSPTFWDKLEMAEFFSNMCEAVLKKRSEVEYLKNHKFDVAITNGIDFCGIGIARYLGIKNQITYVPNPVHENAAFYIGVPQPISYVPVVEYNPLGPKMGFIDRVNNFKEYLLLMFVQKYYIKKTTQAFRRQLGQKFPSISNLASETNLCFINGNEFLDAARPILHKTVYIGGLGLEDPKPLQEPYKSLMEKGKKGVILLSFGTIAPTTFIKQSLKEEIFEALGEFKDYHFIVKIDTNDEISRGLAAKFENIDVSDWLPQTDILAHPRLKVFIVHGGYNSLLESVIHGVPVIVVPMFADQFRNGKNVEYRGFGYYLDRKEFGKASLSKALNTVLNDPSYKNSAIRLSQLIKNKPFTPEETFFKWTRFVAEHGVLPELHVEGAKMNFIQYFCLDVIFVFLTAFIVLLYISFKLLKIFANLFIKIFGGSKIKSE